MKKRLSEMDQQYYIRVRGRVQGPFSPDYLRGLARRGMFGRLHEVSEDGANWTRAESFPELYAVSAEPRATVIDVADDDEVGINGRESASEHSSSNSAGWYYLVDSQQFGPIPREQLEQLVRSRQLPGTTQVWTEGLQGWSAAAQVFALTTASGGADLAFGGRADPSAQSPTAGGISSNTHQALIRTRPWVIFVAILGLAYMGITAVIGLMSFILGAKTSSIELVSQGIAEMLGAGLQLCLALLLLKYANRINALRFSDRVEHLEEALDAQRQFWSLTGAILLAVLIIGVIGGIVLLATA